MKRLLITGLVLLLAVSGIFATGSDDPVPADDGVTTIRLVGKDFSPADEWNLLHREQSEKGFAE